VNRVASRSDSRNPTLNIPIVLTGRSTDQPDRAPTVETVGYFLSVPIGTKTGLYTLAFIHATQPDESRVNNEKCSFLMNNARLHEEAT